MRQMLTGGLLDGPAIFLVGLVVLVAVTAALVAARRRTAQGVPASQAAFDAVVLAGLIGAVGAALVFTLVPSSINHFGPPANNLVPFASIRRVAANSVDVLVALRILLGNVLLFVPVGFFVALHRRAGHPLRDAVLGSLALSLLIEVTQALVPLGRVANVDDVILNVLGGTLGALAAMLVGSAAPRLGLAWR
jgi:glycopeptide antibiotics resistance protein